MTAEQQGSGESGRYDPVADGQTFSGVRCELCGVVRMNAMESRDGVVRCQDRHTCDQVVALVAGARSAYADLVEAGWTPVTQGSDESGEGLSDGQANDCTHGSATGIDTTPMSDPSKVWRCDHCGLRWSDAAYVSAEGSDVPTLAAAVARVDAERIDLEGRLRISLQRAESAEAALATARREADELRAEAESLRRDWHSMREQANDALAEREEMQARLVAVEVQSRRLAAYDCTEEPVPPSIDVPDDYEAGIHDAAVEIRAALANPSAAQVTSARRTSPT